MKKLISLLLIVTTIFAAFSLSGCNKEEAEAEKTLADVTPTELMDAVVAAYPSIPAQKVLYVSGLTEDDEGYLEPDYASYLYTGQYELAPEIAMLDAFAIRLPDGKSAFELHILKIADENNAPAIEALLNKRIEIIKSGDIALYDPAGFEATMPNAKVYNYGNKYIMLIITTDNAPAVAAIESKLYQ